MLRVVTFPCSLIAPMPHTHLHLHVFRTRKAKDRSLEAKKNNALSEIWENLRDKIILFFAYEGKDKR